MVGVGTEAVGEPLGVVEPLLGRRSIDSARGRDRSDQPQRARHTAHIRLVALELGRGGDRKFFSELYPRRREKRTHDLVGGHTEISQIAAASRSGPRPIAGDQRGSCEPIFVNVFATTV
jgi:hypothetical protein